ncbi:MAG: DUF721 domain-containing protein [Alphaproteobacteria bacterium]
MRPLSESTSRIASKSFSRKYISLGRIINQWSEIMGQEFSDKAQPVKINYRKKTRNKEQSATLDIATTSSYATILPYQKGVILERLNRLFGDNWITDIRFVASSLEETPKQQKKIISPLTQGEKKYLSSVLDEIDDPDLNAKLESLGKAIITDTKQ